MANNEDSPEPIAVHINRRTCAATQTCVATAPNAFRFSAEKGITEVITEVITDPGTIALVRDAEDLCPTQSILITS